MNDRYGKRRVPALIQKVQRHRELVREQGSPEIQASWDRIEEFVDFLYQEVGRKKTLPDVTS